MAPSDTQFENLKKRVKDLEEKTTPSPLNISWIQKHQVLTWLISLTIPTIALLVAIYAGVIPHIEKDDALQITVQVGDGLRSPLQKIDGMSNDISGINATLKAWAPFITPQFFKKTASLPDKQFLASLPQLRTITQIASESKSEIPSKDVVDIGRRTISLASGNSSTATLAWDATTALLQYRSVLNNASPPAALDAATNSYNTHYHSIAPPGYVTPKVRSTLPPVPREQSAASDFIGHDENKDQPSGPAALIFEGGGIALDGMHMKNVILINVHVVYHGAPMNLENVSFLNCTFEIISDTNGRQLAEGILTSPATTVSTS